MPKPDVSDKRIPEILDAAAQVFSARGVDAATMAQIAKTAEISKAAVYYYFESKEALIDALVENLFVKDTGWFSELVEENSPAAPRLLRYCESLSENLGRNGELFPLMTEFYSRSARSELLHGKMQLHFSQYLQGFKAIIDQGIHRGEFLSGLDTETAALTLVSIIEGALIASYHMDLPAADTLRELVASYLEKLGQGDEGGG